MLTLLFRADGSCPRFYHNVVDHAHGTRRGIRKTSGIKRALYYGTSEKKNAGFSVLEKREDLLKYQKGFVSFLKNVFCLE